MEKILYRLPTIFFNLAEILVIILIGKLLELSLNIVVLVVTLFAIIRTTLGGAMHYKHWYRCMIWSTLFFLSLFVVAKVDLLIAICLTAFEGVILTKKGNIKDIFMWSGNALNQEVFDWVKFNQDNQYLKEYEEILKKTDKKKYYIFVYRFKEFKSYSQIAKLMDSDTQRISEEIKIMSHFIEYSIRMKNINLENKE